MLRDYFSLAVENLRVRQLRTWLTMIGIFIGIAAIVSLISLGQGMKDAISLQFQSLGSDKVTIQAKGLNIGPPGSGAAVSLSVDDLKHIEKVSGVKRAAGRLIKPVQATFDNKNYVVYMADIPNEDKSELFMLTIPADAGACLLLGHVAELFFVFLVICVDFLIGCLLSGACLLQSFVVAFKEPR